MDFFQDFTTLSTAQAALLEALLQEMAADSPANTGTPRIIQIQKSSAKNPLFIIHGTGGKVMFLHALARHMSPAQPIYGIEAATRAVRPGCAPYIEALRKVQPHGPYYLGGYSAGCLIAFEAAAELRQAGEDVAFLLLIDPVALPATPETAQPTPVQRRFEIAKLAGVTPLSPEFPFILQVNRDIESLAQNFSASPINQPIHVIHGTRGPYVPSRATLHSWAALAGGGLKTAAIPADHFEIVRDPHAAATAAKIQSWLDALPG